MGTETNKYRSILENAIPYIFFTRPFPQMNGLRKAAVEFVNPSLLGATGLLQRLPTFPAECGFEAFVREIFADEEAVGSYLAALEEKGRVENVEIRLRGSDGGAFWTQMNSRIISAENGFFVQGMFVNLERVKGLEEALVEEKKKLETILSGVGDAVCIYDRKCKIIFQSSQHRKLFGESVGDMCMYAPAHDGAQKENRDPQRWIEKKTDEAGNDWVYEITSFPVRDEKGAVFAGINIVRDMTTQIELELRTRELTRMRGELEGRYSFESMIGSSPQMKKVFEAVEAVSNLETTVLIQGETGTGKELVARAIHQRSARRDKPFIAVNCGALPETLLESELFGHVKGAFTGAASEKMGLFVAAERGTIFLDEIAEMNMTTQVKLLRVLQEGKVRRVGSTKEEEVNARVLVASNRDLASLVTKEMFREDLFYRLHVFPIFLPPLRVRGDDIFLLAGHFLKFFSQKNRKKVRLFSKDAQKILVEHAWPGNVRELANVVERAVILAKTETITSEELLLPSFIKREEQAAKTSGAAGHSPTLLKDNLDEISLKRIQEALVRNKGNKVITARELGVSRTTLWRKLKQKELGEDAGKK
ncbi:MAG: sigma-54-dependent Fis family transcriptional regulator [Candidatus Omnitrophica bacterium]|nr:sigma-54-dependent Fis family transcriptional regulator [Candidatus Omnitrophota bacterium]